MKTDSAYLFGLIGENIASSLSPSLFTWAMAKTGIHGSYAIYDFPRRLARSLIIHSTSEWTGLNVTSPHKDLAFELCDEWSERAQAVQSVNSLTKREGRIYGDNTDIAGFKFALQRKLQHRETPELALVIGTGGAARSCIYGIRELFPELELHVATRRTGTAADRLASLQIPAGDLRILTHSKAARYLPEYELVVQATPVGHISQAGYPMSPPLNFKRGALVMDLIYTPGKTLFLEAAQAFDADIENGLVMLISQGAECFQAWTGRKFPMEDAMLQLLPEFQRK
jgi:shikimate dehydrogenase